MSLVRFKFHQIRSKSFGLIHRPYALVHVQAKDGTHWVPVEMIVDTGADYTILPARYVTILGYNVHTDCEPELTYGVGGSQTVYLLRQMTVRLGEWERNIPIGFIEGGNAPALLGRHQFMELIDTRFKDRMVVFAV